ncbi:alpha/beta fold hydrolase [Nonomuraea sp. B19D2]|uniref:alpha/beta fold hydrolase n=1 Tax=Nonomuraea sp. B19D2 TaxID=3159561 RepID=UPI0032DBA203
MLPKRPVYILHGLLGTAYGHFGQQIKAWGQDHNLVPIDLPGHGRCPLHASEDYFDDAYAYVLALMERFGRGRLVAASYLGGPLAVRCAAERPDLVSSLVLTGFGTGMDKEAFLGQVAGFHRLTRDNPELVAEFERLHTPRWRDTLAAFTAHTALAYDEWIGVSAEQLGKLSVPTFIINGSLKSIERITAEQAADFGDQIRGLVLEGAGHIAGHDAPEAFNAAVQAFWTEDPER